MPTIATMSGAQFDALPYEEGRRSELLEGELIEVPSATPRHRDIVYATLQALKIYLKEHRSEGAAYADVEFALSEEVRLRPDVCLLLPERALQLDRDHIPIPGAPDLVIEVISPSERTTESHRKVRSYLRNGVAEVWQIYPDTRVLEIYQVENGRRTLSADQQVTTDLLPGFSVTLFSFFE
jgi:Uma2 family endonuclease